MKTCIEFKTVAAVTEEAVGNDIERRGPGGGGGETFTQTLQANSLRLKEKHIEIGMPTHVYLHINTRKAFPLSIFSVL